jgi:hypothetical protein
MEQKDSTYSAPVHRRDISITSYDLGDHRILMEGRLTDNRFRAGARDQDFTGSKIIHDMKVKIVLQGPFLTIENVEGEMLSHPHEDCPQTLPWLSRLAGLKIRSGVTEQIKSLLGGARGCAHLNNLILSVISASLQGYFSAYSREDADDEAFSRQVERLIDTCYVWRKGGPLADEVKKK